MASRGVTFNFGFPARGWGSCLNSSNKIIKNFPRSLRSLDFYKLKLLYLLRQATKFRSFFAFCVAFCVGGFTVVTFIMLVMIEN